MTPGKAGLFLLIRKMTTDKVLDDLKGEGGTVISTSFDHAKEEALKAALAAHVRPRRRRRAEAKPAPATRQGRGPRPRLQVHASAAAGAVHRAPSPIAPSSAAVAPSAKLRNAASAFAASCQRLDRSVVQRAPRPDHELRARSRCAEPSGRLDDLGARARPGDREADERRAREVRAVLPGQDARRQGPRPQAMRADERRDGEARCIVERVARADRRKVADDDRRASRSFAPTTGKASVRPLFARLAALRACQRLCPTSVNSFSNVATKAASSAPRSRPRSMSRRASDSAGRTTSSQ